MKICFQKVTPAERQPLWNLLQYMIFEASPYGIVFQGNALSGSCHPLFEEIRSYGENERDGPVTTGVGDALRKKMDDNCALEDYHE